VNNAAVVRHMPLASFMTGAVIPLDGGQVIDRE